MHETASITTDLGLKPTGRARQQGDPNVPDQPNQRGQDVKYFPNDLMQYILYEFYDHNLNQMQKCAKMVWYGVM